ncbi:hypothetical protein ACIA8I_38535 [Streptomyces rishiriensis]|uniref:hypothetical protein n=1 Tax=Streptomyces rishiriensis TaxID=68264 RepID=UPI0037A45303
MATIRNVNPNWNEYVDDGQQRRSVSSSNDWVGVGVWNVGEFQQHRRGRGSTELCSS